MNNIEIILSLLFVVSIIVCFFSGISLFLCDIEGINSKKCEIIFVISIITLMLSLVALTIYFTKNPQPTFREVCEANNGIYIDNRGRAGDSCIYNRQVGEE